MVVDQKVANVDAKYLISNTGHVTEVEIVKDLTNVVECVDKLVKRSVRLKIKYYNNFLGL